MVKDNNNSKKRFFSSSEDKKSQKNSEKIAEYESLQKTFEELQAEEKQLNDYLNLNIFSYVQNKENVENVFTIANPSIQFLEQSKDCKNINSSIPVLEINNLTKYYASKKTPSLVNLNMKVYLGDLHVIVGNNGAGKTTLFNCLKKLENYDGEIMIDRKELRSEDCKLNDIVGFVSAQDSWDLYSTVEEVIVENFKLLDLSEVDAKNFIRSALEQFKISHLRHSNIIDLSLLEKKKLQIVLSLIKDPHLIIFDEILLGLQQHEVFDILTIFFNLKQENRALIVLTHSFNEFSKFANTISILVKGKIYYTGSIENLFLSQNNKYSIVTLDNSTAIKILEAMNCKFSYNKLIDTIYANFDGKLNLLLFQKECVEKNIIIQELKPLEINVEDLYPLLAKTGSRDAIKDINVTNFFTPL